MTTATSTIPDAHVILPTAKHTKTVIFLHGRGSNATEFAGELLESQAIDDRFFTQIFPGMKWVFPCAAMRWAKTEQEEMCQWFDMALVQHPNKHVEIQSPGLTESVQRILEELRVESAGVGAERVFLAGISQGCATAILALVLGGVEIGGFVGLCGWLPLQEALRNILVETTSTSHALIKALRKLLDIPPERYPLISDVSSAIPTPVLIQHTQDDAIIPVANGLELVKGLRDLGMHVEWQCFKHGGHWLNEPEGIDGIVKFFQTHGVIADDARPLEKR